MPQTEAVPILRLEIDVNHPFVLPASGVSGIGHKQSIGRSTAEIPPAAGPDSPKTISDTAA